MLEKYPRADMSGFKACPLDQQRQKKYAMRRRAELHSRQAILAGQRAYDLRTEVYEKESQ
jgi:hypothetical protein